MPTYRCQIGIQPRMSLQGRRQRLFHACVAKTQRCCRLAAEICLDYRDFPGNPRFSRQRPAGPRNSDFSRGFHPIDFDSTAPVTLNRASAYYCGAAGGKNSVRMGIPKDPEGHSSADDVSGRDPEMSGGSIENKLDLAGTAASDGHPALMHRIAEDRDQEVFKVLFGHFAPRVKSLMLKQGAENASAEDPMRDTMLAVWNKADRYSQSRRSVGAWIFTIARNLRIDRFRQEGSLNFVDIDEFDAPKRRTGRRSGIQHETAKAACHHGP